MKKLLTILFAIMMLFSPINAVAQMTDYVTSAVKTGTEIWHIRWIYRMPEGVPERPVTFTKLNEPDKYLVNFNNGGSDSMILKKTQNSFLGEIKMGSFDVVTLQGSIDQTGIVYGRWSARSMHSGKLIGYISNK